MCASIVLAAWWIYPVMRLHYAEQRNLASLQAEYHSLAARNTNLAHEVDRLKTPQGVAEQARQTLGLVGPGEHTYVIIDPSAAASDSTEATRPAPTEAAAPPDPVTALLDRVFGVAP